MAYRKLLIVFVIAYAVFFLDWFAGVYGESSRIKDNYLIIPIATFFAVYVSYGFDLAKSSDTNYKYYFEVLFFLLIAGGHLLLAFNT